jgi:hypothetical protein
MLASKQTKRQSKKLDIHRRHTSAKEAVKTILVLVVIIHNDVISVPRNLDWHSVSQHVKGRIESEGLGSRHLFLHTGGEFLIQGSRRLLLPLAR